MRQPFLLRVWGIVLDEQLLTGLNLRIAQRTILRMIDPGSTVLDVGSGGGELTKALSERGRCAVTAVEIDSDWVARAEPYARKVVLGSIEDDATWDAIQCEFDYVVFADVLEHLVDPWSVLRRCRGALKNGGRVLASIPNIAYYRVRQDLLLGRFDYVSAGILDRTHLRFFTAKTVAALFSDSDYTLHQCERVYTSAKNRLLAKISPNAFTYQFVVNAGPAVADGQMAVL